MDDQYFSCSCDIHLCNLHCLMPEIISFIGVKSTKRGEHGEAREGAQNMHLYVLIAISLSFPVKT